MNVTDILLVEDNPNDIRLTIEALEPYKLQIAVVRDGADALDFLFATGPYSHRSFAAVPKLILMDLKLPKVDGLEVTRRLKANRLTRNIPIVILTTSTEDRDLIATYQAGVNSYIVKPLEFDRFALCMRTLVTWWLQLNHLPNRIPS